MFIFNLKLLFIRFVVTSSGKIGASQSEHNIGLDELSDGEVIDFQGNYSDCQKVSKAISADQPDEINSNEMDLALKKQKKEIAIKDDLISSLRKEKAEILKALQLANDQGNFKH